MRSHILGIASLAGILIALYFALVYAPTEQTMGKPPVFTSEIGPVIGVHVGPGLLGVGGVALSHLA